MLLMFRTLRILDVLPLFDEMKLILSFKKKKKKNQPNWGLTCPLTIGE
jgi:hypothetical protein